MSSKTRPLTDRQAEILEFIRDFIAMQGFAPAVRDLGAAFHMTPNGVMCHLRALEKKGYITHEPGLARTMRVVHDRRKIV